MKNFTKSSKIFIPAIIVLLILVYVVGFRNTAPKYETAVAAFGTLEQVVSLTGSVTPVQSVDLAFERGGRVARVSIAVGEKVAKGQVLLSLDATALVLDLKQAQATLDADSANLNELKNGTRKEDLAVLGSKYSAAQIALSDAKSSLYDSIRESYTKADDAVRNYGDQFFDNPRSSSVTINITVNDSQLKMRLNSTRGQIEQTLIAWASALSALSKNDDLAASVRDSENNLSLISSFLDDLALAVNALTPSQSLSQTTITTYRSNVSSARTEVVAALSSLLSANNGYSTAKSNLDLAEKNLEVGKAGSTPEAIQAAEAKVASDLAHIDSVRHSIGVSSLYAPFPGVVTKQDGKVGQVAVASQSLVSIIGDGFMIEVNVPEADIAKMAVGQDTKVTLDAYGSDTVFAAIVSKIDPAEIMIDNVATYKVTFNFLQADPRIKSGLTANLDVLAAKKSNVLLVPVRAVVEENGRKTVRIPTGANTTMIREVRTGLKGSSGQIEIISGLSAGEKVVVGNK